MSSSPSTQPQESKKKHFTHHIIQTKLKMRQRYQAKLLYARITNSTKVNYSWRKKHSAWRQQKMRALKKKEPIKRLKINHRTRFMSSPHMQATKMDLRYDSITIDDFSGWKSKMNTRIKFKTNLFHHLINSNVGFDPLRFCFLIHNIYYPFPKLQWQPYDEWFLASQMGTITKQ